jgi:hypothetical protein
MYSPAAAMYAAAAGYPGYIGYPVQYYPYYPTAVQPSIQPLRPTIMIPVNWSFIYDSDQTAMGLPPVMSVAFLIVILVKRGCLGGISERPSLPLRG